MYEGDKQKYQSSCIVAAAMLALLFVSTPARGQFQAMVKRVTSETNDGIRITAWVEQQKVKLKQSVAISYEVENRSAQPIYLVRRTGELETAVNADGVFLIMIPLPFPEEHGDYNYSFTKIRRGDTYKGHLTISADKFTEDRRWSIDVAFGLVADITGLDRRPAPNEDPAPLRGLLGKRIKVLGVNGLVIEVEEA